MSVSLSVHTITEHLDMYGEPDHTSAYALSGHVAISVSRSCSFFRYRRSARFLLQSLSLTFEGHSEIFTPSTGYAATRLCSITRELLPNGKTIELSSEAQEDSSEPCVWNIIFNVPIPGWLPASTSITAEEIGVRYNLYATAKLLDLDENKHSPWAFATVCAPFKSRVRAVQTQKRMSLRRYVAPPSEDRPTFSTLSYLVNNHTFISQETGKGKRIPPQVLSNIQVITSLPEFVDVNGGALNVAFRTRADNLSEEECKRLQLIDITMDLHQTDKFRIRPSTSYSSRYPLPPPERQPPCEPLIDPHPLSNMYDVELFTTDTRCESVSRTFSLLPPHESGHYKLTDDNHVYANDYQARTWYTLDMSIPFLQATRAVTDRNWTPVATLKPSSSSPLSVVYHELVFCVTLGYENPDSPDVVRAKLNFRVPVSFGMVAPTLPQPTVALTPAPERVNQVSDPQTSRIPALPVVEPYAPVLPAYSQLYDANGERKVDYSHPLPLYTPPIKQKRESGASFAGRASLEVFKYESEETPLRQKLDISPPPFEEISEYDARKANQPRF